MVELSVIRDIVAILGALVAFSYYILELRNQNKQKNAQMYLEYFDKLMSEPLKSKMKEVMTWEWEDYDDFEEKYGKLPNNESIWSMDSNSPPMILYEVLLYYEILGVLWSEGHFDVRLLARNPATLWYCWEKYEELIYEWRKRLDVPHWWIEFENLFLILRESYRRTNPMRDTVATFQSRREALGLPTY